MKQMLWLALFLALAACVPALPDVGKVFPSVAGEPAPTRTPFLPASSTPEAAEPVLPTIELLPTLTPAVAAELPDPVLWLDPAVPDGLKSALLLPEGMALTSSREAATLELGPIRGGPPFQSFWIYAVVAPFPTVLDDVSGEDVMAAWHGTATAAFGERPLLMSPGTKAAFTALWGPSSGGQVLEVTPESLADTSWSSRPSWAIIPFENLEPRWKVLSVDGANPLDPQFDPQGYLLTVWFGIRSTSGGDIQALRDLTGEGNAILPPSNRDASRLTTLVMTGTTALTRATASKMDLNGVDYPARDIRDWLVGADLLHISNEVSFNENCPPGDPFLERTIFCSRPEYIGLLDYIGADIIELSGNHNNDWGTDAYTYTLGLYAERGWLVFAGGASQEEARKPRLIERNGTRLAFLGCNLVGPTAAWATDDLPGAATCDVEAMTGQIQDLKSQGYLPIVTIQYHEYYDLAPAPDQRAYFQQFAGAGAVIVSGSQSHFPQGFDLVGGAFIHYGPGNLFFDQMDEPVAGTRREFIDRHVFYNGRHISTVLLTAMLEDWSRPRPMTLEERQLFLAEVFAASGW